MLRLTKWVYSRRKSRIHILSSFLRMVLQLCSIYHPNLLYIFTIKEPATRLYEMKMGTPLRLRSCALRSHDSFLPVVIHAWRQWKPRQGIHKRCIKLHSRITQRGSESCAIRYLSGNHIGSRKSIFAPASKDAVDGNGSRFQKKLSKRLQIWKVPSFV